MHATPAPEENPEGGLAKRFRSPPTQMDAPSGLGTVEAVARRMALFYSAPRIGDALAARNSRHLPIRQT